MTPLDLLDMPKKVWFLHEAPRYCKRHQGVTPCYFELEVRHGTPTWIIRSEEVSTKDYHDVHQKIEIRVTFGDYQTIDIPLDKVWRIRTEARRALATIQREQKGRQENRHNNEVSQDSID